ncbi:hypothetical protein FRC07_014014 [Ceratobasidium sp. 392]|nr:hypothetical protein FRC07_014014 [Ceratobasidium sp. 392]
MILDGNTTGALGRLKIPNEESSYHNLIGLDLIELLKDQIKWDHRARAINLFNVEFSEQLAKIVLDDYRHDRFDGQWLPVNPFSKLDSYWRQSPASDKVHLLVEIKPDMRGADI